MYQDARQFSASESAGVTEVVLPEQSQSQLTLVLPMLAHLSRQSGDRWFTWIAPRNISRQMLTEYGFDLSKVRLIHTRDSEETLWVLWQALAEGNSDTVVASPGKVSDRALNRLEEAALIGRGRGLLIRYR